MADNLNIQDQPPASVENIAVAISTDAKPAPVPGKPLLISDTGQIYSNDGATWTPVNKHVEVASLADLPAPVAGVITLAASTTYLVNGEIDLGTNRIVWSSRAAVIGTNRVNDRLTYNGTGVAFTIGPGSVVGLFKEIGLRAPTGTLVDVSGASVSFIDVGFATTLTGGTIALSGAFSFGVRTSSAVSAFTGTGFAFTGSSTSACRIFDNLTRNNAGTMFDFGTSSFGVIDIGRNVVDTPAGATFASGTTGGVNVTENGIVVSNSFIGAGTGIATITGSDPNWIFRSNAGAADSLLPGSAEFSSSNASNSSLVAGGPVAAETPGVVPAKATDMSRPAVGVAVSSASSGGTVTVRTGGTLTLSDWTAAIGSSTLTPRQVYYVDPAADGRFTATVPVAVGQSLQIVGVGVTTDTLGIQIGQPILL